MNASSTAPGRGFRWVLLLCGTLAFLVLIGLGTWQVQRLFWKEALLSEIAHRTAGAPEALADIEARSAKTGDVDYWPVVAHGTFRHSGEQHFFATHEGRPGYFLYTPLELADGRFLFVNRGFVPYELKDPATRPQSQPDGESTVRGLARNPLAAKPSWLVPDNDPAKNVFYWKDMAAMTAAAGLPQGAVVLPFFVDADATPNPGGLPVGGVTLLDLPNNHLQYAITWYGLAAALVAVGLSMMLRRRSDDARRNGHGGA